LGKEIFGVRGIKSLKTGDDRREEQDNGCAKGVADKKKKTTKKNTLPVASKKRSKNHHPGVCGWTKRKIWNKTRRSELEMIDGERAGS